MKSILYTKHNFHNATFCIWKQVTFAEIEGLKINHTSKSGSGYIFLDTGVFRLSNHWGRVSNCRWRLLPLSDFKNQNQTVAFAKWTDFLSNDEKLKLFYISVNFKNKTASFEHAENGNYDGKLVARNAAETTKRIQLIATIFADTKWSKHLIYDNFEKLQTEIINKLIFEDKSWIEIKKDYL